MAVHLATEYFFGESVMGLSTPTGVGTHLKLDQGKLGALSSQILQENGQRRTSSYREQSAGL